MKTILLVLAVVLLAVGLVVKGYGMMQLANKKLSEEERMARYKKTMPLFYALLLPAIVIVAYLLVTK